jgi:hypothetical protein
MTVREIIKDCGGAIAVSRASQRTASAVTNEAVFKWYRNGIPEDHWPMIMELSGRTVDQIYQANRIAERLQSEKGRRRGRAQAAA